MIFKFVRNISKLSDLKEGDILHAFRKVNGKYKVFGMDYSIWKKKFDDAEKISQNAQEAKTLATQAKNTADGIADTANSALTKAESAKSTAEGIADTANTAKQTANEAKQVANTTQSELNNKSDKGHKHNISNVTNLQTSIDGINSDLSNKAEKSEIPIKSSQAESIAGTNDSKFVSPINVHEIVKDLTRLSKLPNLSNDVQSLINKSIQEFLSLEDSDNIINKVKEVIDAFANSPESLNIATELANRYTKAETEEKITEAKEELKGGISSDKNSLQKLLNHITNTYSTISSVTTKLTNLKSDILGGISSDKNSLKKLWDYIASNFYNKSDSDKKFYHDGNKPRLEDINATSKEYFTHASSIGEFGSETEDVWANICELTQGQVEIAFDCRASSRGGGFKLFISKFGLDISKKCHVNKTVGDLGLEEVQIISHKTSYVKDNPTIVRVRLKQLTTEHKYKIKTTYRIENAENAPLNCKIKSDNGTLPTNYKIIKSWTKEGNYFENESVFERPINLKKGTRLIQITDLDNLPSHDSKTYVKGYFTYESKNLPANISVNDGFVEYWFWWSGSTYCIQKITDIDTNISAIRIFDGDANTEGWKSELEINKLKVKKIVHENLGNNDVIIEEINDYKDGSNAGYGWRKKYIGSTKGVAGNKLRWQSSNSSKGMDLNHDGDLEIDNKLTSKSTLIADNLLTRKLKTVGSSDTSGFEGFYILTDFDEGKEGCFRLYSKNAYDKIVDIYFSMGDSANGLRPVAKINSDSISYIVFKKTKTNKWIIYIQCTWSHYRYSDFLVDEYGKLSFNKILDLKSNLEIDNSIIDTNYAERTFTKDGNYVDLNVLKNISTKTLTTGSLSGTKQNKAQYFPFMEGGCLFNNHEDPTHRRLLIKLPEFETGFMSFILHVYSYRFSKSFTIKVSKYKSTGTPSASPIFELIDGNLTFSSDALKSTKLTDTPENSKLSHWLYIDQLVDWEHTTIIIKDVEFGRVSELTKPKIELSLTTDTFTPIGPQVTITDNRTPKNILNMEFETKHVSQKSSSDSKNVIYYG
jgi:hypothetical protein